MTEAPNQKREYSGGVWIAAGIFFLAMLVRFTYLHQSMASPTFNCPIVDAQGYDVRAREIISGKGLTQDIFYQQVFYPFFLSAIYFLTGSSILWAKIIQSVLGCLTCVLTYYLGARIFNRAAGILAALFTVFYGPLIFHEAELITGGLATLWFVAMILLILRIQGKENFLPYLFAGVCAVLAVLTRPNFLPIVIAAAIWLLIALYRAGAMGRSLLTVLAGMSVGFGAIAVPVAFVNYHVTGHFGILPATGGINAYIGNNPHFSAGTVRPGIQWERVNDKATKNGVSRNMWDRQKFFYAKTREYILTQPWSFLKGMAHKAVQFVSSREMPGNVDIYVFRQWSPLLSVLLWKDGRFGFPFGILLPLALVGIIIRWRQIPAVVLIFVFIYPLTVIWAHVESRYRVPMIPALAVFAAAACLSMFDMARQRRWNRVTAFAAAFSLIAALSSLAGPFVEEKFNYKAEMYLGVATYEEMHGKIAEAITDLQKAIALNPTYPEAYASLGKNFSQEGRQSEAVENYREALKLDPNSYIAHCGLGTALERQGKFDEALSEFEEALHIKPDYAVAQANIGFELQRRGQVDQAMAHLEEAIRLEPSNAQAQLHLGIILAQRDKIPEAIKHFEEAVRSDPNLSRARESLGATLATQGRLDEAIEQFRAVSRLQPANADAHFLTGLCLLRSERPDEAQEEFRKALALDPNNAKAKEALNEILQRKSR